MKSNIKNFVEEYNKRMSWNADIIKQIGKKNIKDVKADQIELLN